MDDFAGPRSTNHIEDWIRTRDHEDRVAWAEATHGHPALPEDGEPLPWPPPDMVVCPRCNQGLLVMRRTTYSEYYVHPDRLWDPERQDKRGGDVHLDTVFCDNTACGAEWKTPKFNARLDAELNPPPTKPGVVMYDPKNTGITIWMLLGYLREHDPNAHDRWLRSWPQLTKQLEVAGFGGINHLFEDLDPRFVQDALEHLVRLLGWIAPDGFSFKYRTGPEAAWGYWPIEEED